MSNPTECGGCSVVWHQAGNRTGHCSGCHRTFSGVDVFDRHFRHDANGPVCQDPATLTDRNGEPRALLSYTDPCGATVWRRPTAEAWESRRASGNPRPNSPAGVDSHAAPHSVAGGRPR